jgi:hypothetical protein
MAKSSTSLCKIVLWGFATHTRAESLAYMMQAWRKNFRLSYHGVVISIMERGCNTVGWLPKSYQVAWCSNTCIMVIRQVGWIDAFVNQIP